MMILKSYKNQIKYCTIVLDKDTLTDITGNILMFCPLNRSKTFSCYVLLKSVDENVVNNGTFVFVRSNDIHSTPLFPLVV